MKKVITILLLSVAIMAGMATADAKTTKKGSKSTASNIVVNKNEYGYANPLGHTYKLVNNGFTFVLSFEDPYTVVFDVKHGSDRKIESWGWEQKGDIIYIYDDAFRISEDGKTLTELGANLVLKIVK